MSPSESDSAPSTPKKIRVSQQKKTHRVQKYRVDWERHPRYSPWLAPDPKCNTKARCTWCNVSFVADICLIKNHGGTKKHKKNESAYESAQNPVNMMNKYFKPHSNSEKTVKNAEIKLCGFMAAHNIPYAIIDDLIPCLKSALPDSNILKEITMKRLKTTRIITNVIGASHKDKIANDLQKHKFSILTDDSTDCSNIKTACVVVRYYDEESGKITSKFWDLTSVFPNNDPKAAEEGATGQRLYDLLIKTFVTRNVPLGNIISFGCDGASVNVGAHNSIASRLKESCPGIIIMKCVCHSLHLAASNACEAHLPRSCEDLARNVHNYVQHSAKRVAGLAVFQKFLNVAVHKILHPAQTRWLSLLAVVERMLEQWEPLQLYFTEIYLQERTVAAESIFTWLRDPFVKLFYLFLSWVLPKVTSMNTLFQSDFVIITSLGKKMEIAFKELLSSYMKHEYIGRTPLNEIDPFNKDKFLLLENMYLGVQVLEELKKPEIQAKQEQIKDFYVRCRNFMGKLCKGIQERFDFSNPLLLLIPLLHPSKALSRSERNSTNSLLKLCDVVIRAKPQNMKALQEVDDEWRRLPLDDLPEDTRNETQVDVFWHKVSKLKDSGGVSKYTELPKFALAVLSIPHANADCERVFSKYNLVKTKSRNRLIVKNIEGVMLASQCVKTNKSCCAGFTPTKDMYDRMTSKILYDCSKQNNLENNEIEDISGLNFVFEEPLFDSE